MWKACIILLIGLSFQRSQAQDSYSLSGKVVDSIGIPLYPATIRVIATPDTLNTLTREDGTFSFKNLRTRKFRLKITMKGYQPVDRAMNVAGDQHSIQLPSLILQTQYGDLDPVTVTRVRPITITDDTVSYNVAAFPTPDGSEVEDILKRLPGVEVDMNGNVIVQGKTIGKVLVDGKEFFGGDVLLAIRNLPADVVDKIQIIDDYGDQAKLTGVKSGDPAKVLNIVLKPDKRNGEFGRAEVAGGEQGKYVNNAFANAFAGDRQISTIGSFSNNNPAGNDPVYKIGINYADKWNSHLDGSINGNTDGQSPRSSSSGVQQNFYTGEQLDQSQDNQNSSHSDNSSIGGRLTYKPDHYSTLRLTASDGQSQSTNQTVSNFTSFQKDSAFTKSTTGQSQNNNHSTGQNINTSVYFEHLSPHSRRRFNIQVNFNLSNSFQSANNLSNALVLTDSVPSNSILHYLVTNNTQNYHINLNGTYFLPLGQTSYLELGYREQANTSNNKINTQQPDSLTSAVETIDSLSQNIVLRSFSQNFHAGYTGQLNKFSLTAGLDIQPGQLRGTVDSKGNITSFSYLSLLPSAGIAWAPDKTRRLNLTFNGNPNLPGLQQLSPFTNLTNPQYPVTGNPNLKPAYTTTVALHFEQSPLKPTQFFGYGMVIGYSATQNTIIQNLTQPRDTSQIIQETTYLNAGPASSFYADYHLSFPPILDKRLRINVSGDFSHNQTPTMTDSTLYSIQTWTWAQSLHFQLIIPDLIETDLGGTYIITHSVYPASGNLPGTIKSATISLNSRHYIFKNWLLNYQFTQPYTSNGDKLQAAPVSLTASLQRQFLPHKKGTITLTGYNLLNQSAGVSQSASPTGFTQTRSVLTGRYFLLSVQIKFNHFHK